MVFQTENALKEVGDKLDASAKSQVEADLTALKDALAAAPAENMTPDQVADIKAKQDTLMNSANALFAKVYEQAQGAAGAGPQPGADAGSQSGPADDVVDGDYKEV